MASVVGTICAETAGPFLASSTRLKLNMNARTMTNERKNITQPADWWAAWKAQAKKEGLSLSAWIGKQCNERLTKAEQNRLSKRAPAHRPKKEPE